MNESASSSAHTVPAAEVEPPATKFGLRAVDSVPVSETEKGVNFPSS